MDKPNSNTPKSEVPAEQETSTLENLKNAKEQHENTVEQLSEVGSQLGRGFSALRRALRKAGGR